MRAAALLQQEGAEVLLSQQSRAFCEVPGAVYMPGNDCHRQADAVVTVGGDGTILHEAPLAMPWKKPILGINVGRCGFLATCEPDEMPEKLRRVAAGDYQLDARALLEARSPTAGWQEYALNDVVVAKGPLQQTIDVEILCDDILVEHFCGDGVIVATPTGSTAYSLAAGGPILDSQTKGMVLTPICPHSLYSPAMVFAPERKLTVRMAGTAGQQAGVSCDGRTGRELHRDSGVEVTLSDERVFLISFGRADQFMAIDQKIRNRK